MKVIESELIPTSSHKSFYGKARIYTAKNGVFLRSYSTIVAGFDRRTGKVSRYSDWASATTRRHVKSFLDSVDASVSTKDFWGLPLSKSPVLECAV